MRGSGVDPVKRQTQWELRLSVNSALRSRRSQWCNSTMAQQADRAREEVQREWGAKQGPGHDGSSRPYQRAGLYPEGSRMP